MGIQLSKIVETSLDAADMSVRATSVKLVS